VVHRADHEILGMKKFFILIVLLAVTAAASSEAAVVTYTDKLGRSVTVSVPVKRAVFLLTYELIPALGIWDKVVGIGRWAYDNDLMKAVRPDIKRSVPSAGTGSDLNIEALLKLKPDLVITWTYKPENTKFMEEKGLKVIAVYPESLQELYDSMKLHGKLFQKERRTDKVIMQMEKIFGIIRDRVSGIPSEKRKKVLWLYGKPTTVACKKGVSNDILSLTGGMNPAASINQRDADIPMERIMAWNPDVIFIWGNATYSAEDILGSQQWRYIKAVREGRVYKAPEWSTWSPRLAPVALWIAIKTYPEYFRDINFEKITDDFYRKVFGIPYGKVKKIEA
jgi:iron complex transport system substrate-binding protein